MKAISKKRLYTRFALFFISILILISMFFAINIFSKASTGPKQLNLSHKQLIILNNYLYLEDNYQLVPIKEQLEKYKTNGEYDKSLINLPASGIKDSDMIAMFKEIEKDPVLLDLVAVSSIDTDIRAVCFAPSSEVDKANAEAVMVFLGTKPLDSAWLDCLEGAYYEDTRLQLEALDFHKQVSEYYNITTVTGHSKGGNLAQYITVTNGENIRECVSFNGQGFSNLFINKYRDSIATYGNKITSIVSYKEPINTLLNSISGNILIIQTNQHIDSLSSHVSSYLYNNMYFDNEGDYLPTQYTDRTNTIKKFDSICDKLINNVDSKYIKSISETSAPALGTIIPMLQDAMAREDVSLINGFWEELKNRIKSNKNNKLSEDDIEYLKGYLLF